MSMVDRCCNCDELVTRCRCEANPNPIYRPGAIAARDLVDHIAERLGIRTMPKFEPVRVEVREPNQRLWDLTNKEIAGTITAAESAELDGIHERMERLHG